MFEVRPLYFVIRLYARNDISKNARKKHGQDIITEKDKVYESKC